MLKIVEQLVVRRAKQSLSRASSSCALVVDKSQPYGNDDVDTQVHPLMDDFVKQYDSDLPLKGFQEIPSTPTVAQFIQVSVYFVCDIHGLFLGHF